MEFKYRCPVCGNNVEKTVEDWKEGDEAPKYFCMICEDNPESIIVKEGDSWPILPTANQPKTPEA